MDHLPVSDIIEQRVAMYVGYTHTQVASHKITGYSFEDDYQYGGCSCSSRSMRSLKIEYEVTTKRGATRTGRVSMSSDEVEELVEQAVRSLIP